MNSDFDLVSSCDAATLNPACLYPVENFFNGDAPFGVVQLGLNDKDRETLKQFHEVKDERNSHRNAAAQFMTRYKSDFYNSHHVQEDIYKNLEDFWPLKVNPKLLDPMVSLIEKIINKAFTLMPEGGRMIPTLTLFDPRDSNQFKEFYDWHRDFNNMYSPKAFRFITTLEGNSTAYCIDKAMGEECLAEAKYNRDLPYGTPYKYTVPTFSAPLGFSTVHRFGGGVHSAPLSPLPEPGMPLSQLQEYIEQLKTGRRLFFLIGVFS